MAKAKKQEAEILLDYSVPPFEIGKIYKNRNIGKLKVISIDKKSIEYEMLSEPGLVIKESLDDVFESICRNTYFEEWCAVNNVEKRIEKRED